MRALWSDRQNCSHNVSQKLKRFRRFSDKTPFGSMAQRNLFSETESRSLGNGVRKNGVRNRCPYRRCGVDTEIPYRLLSLILCSGESVEAKFSRWFWRHPDGRY